VARRRGHAARSLPGILPGVLVFWLAGVFAGAAPAIEHHTAHGGPVKGLALSPDRRWLVTTSFDYTAVLWSLPAFTERATLVGHEAAVNTAAFSPDGRWLVTAGDDNTIRVWPMAALLTGDRPVEPRVLRGHTAKVVDLAFSADGRRLASSSWDHRVGLWSLPGFTSDGFLAGYAAPVNAARFSRDGQTLYSAGADGQVRQWDVASAGYLRSPVDVGWGINVLAVDEDHDLLAYGTSSGLMRSTSLRGAGRSHDYARDGAPVLALTWDRERRRLAFGDSEGRIVVADPQSGEIERDFRAVAGPAWGLLQLDRPRALLVAGLDDFVTSIPLDDAEPPSPGASERRFHPLGELDNGARQFARKCSVCHSLEADGKRRAGPTLYRVIGRRAGAVAGYPYSAALANADIVWDEHTIEALFVAGPDVVTPGSKMPLQRIPDSANRRDLIDFLKSAAGSDVQ
jgi:cytochrome c